MHNYDNALLLNEQADDWALITIGDIELLIRQAYIRQISHLGRSAVFEYRSGLLCNVTDSDHGYIAISAKLASLPKMPPERFVTTEIAHGDGSELVWCWDEMVLLNHTQFDFFELPAALLRANSPLRYATAYKDGLAFYADMDVLQQYVLLTAS